MKLRLLFILPFAAILASCGGSSTGTVEPRCGTVPYPPNAGYIVPTPIVDSPQVWSFVSAPHLHPMKPTINTALADASDQPILVGPYTSSGDALYGQTGSLILDNDGNPVWFRPLSSPNLMNTDFQVQQLYGKPVLTFWQGTVATPPGYTNLPAGGPEPGACFYILDNNYRVVKTMSAQNGFTSDVHEFLLTPANTALFMSAKVVPMNLTPYGGPQNGFVHDFAIQEVDVKTNRLLFFWDALEHIPLTASFQPASTAVDTSNVWDAYHLNSIGFTDTPDDILVSGRNTWTIYRIHKSTGAIVWRLGGKESDFTIESGAQFAWQHDARMLAPNLVSMFDDECCESTVPPPGTTPSHGLFLQLDFSAMTASAQTTYFHDPNLFSNSQGDAQDLPNGDVFVGWGASPYYSEYAAAGNSESDPALNTLYDAQMPGSDISYRVFRSDWRGAPSSPPSIAVRSLDSGITVYASWNGATQVASWLVLAGASADSLSQTNRGDKTGFETPIPAPNSGPYFQVKALNADGRTIGESTIVKFPS